MQNNLTFPDLPADHPLNTGEGIISLHSPKVLTEPRMFIDMPYQHEKRDKCGRTCRNCTNMHCRSDFKCGCGIYGYDDPARNPRTRALKCRYFEHWRKALDKIMF